MNIEQLTASIAAEMNATRGTLNYAIAERAAHVADDVMFFVGEGLEVRAQQRLDESNLGPSVKAIISKYINA